VGLSFATFALPAMLLSGFAGSAGDRVGARRLILAGSAVLAALTSTSSHELCEAITDPIPGQGWYDDQNGEIGDVCAWQTKQLGQFTVQLEWSNREGRCV
jgi:hypothetical protein